MISNIQHQNFDGVIIDKIYSNNTNTNNIQIMATTNQNLNGFTTISPTKMKKSYLEIDQNNIHNNITNYNNININNNAKEIVNVTSQQNNLNYNQNQNENMKMENSIIINNNNNNNNICHNQNAFQQSLKQNINNTKINNNNNNNLFKSDNNNKHINNNINNNNIIIIHNKKELIKTSPIKMIERNENQEHAFRCIEDVHNYSKLKRYNSNDYSTKHDYSSSEVEEEEQDDDDDDYEEDIEYEYNEQQDINNKKQKTEYIIINNNNNNNKNVNKNRNYEISNEKKIKNNIDHVPENDDDEKQTPEHHARRPMNAFLIFCKRHRAIVREKYKHLENRSITKILGDWWATLDIDEKTCYTNLAKQYKDAFFSANPNFKWYKLPAPPLRTLTTRPTNTERPLMISNLNYSYTNDYDTIINNKDLNYRNKQQQEQQQQSEQNDSEEIHQQQQQQQQESIISSTIINNNSIITKKSSSISSSSKNDVGVFKLADEAQMGDLSNLIMHNHSPANENKICSNGNLSSSENENDNNLLDCIKTPPILDLNQKALQSALSETSNFIQNKINQRNDQQLLEPFENMRDHANKMVMNDQQNMITINGKRKSTTPIDEHYFKECKKQLLLQNNHKQDVVHQQQQQQHQEKRSSRSCKGKKYQEFINSGQITTIVKKSKIKTPSSCQTTTSQTFPHNGYCKMINNDIFINKQLKTDNNSTLIRLQQQQQSNNDNLKNIQSLESPTKQFDASDFDLEEKIKALPAQDLDDYLSRKRETKKKKKIKSKRHSTTTVTTTTPTTTAKTAVNKTNNNKQQQHQQQLFMLRQQEVKERLQNAAMVGSQKRKARKESITRRDINSINNDDDNTNLLETVESLVQLGATIKTEEDDGLLQFGATTTIIKTDDDDDDDDLFTNVHPIQLSANKTTSDLLILAQVASNHIDDEILPD